MLNRQTHTILRPLPIDKDNKYNGDPPGFPAFSTKFRTFCGSLPKGAEMILPSFQIPATRQVTLDRILFLENATNAYVEMPYNQGNQDQRLQDRTRHANNIAELSLKSTTHANNLRDADEKRRKEELDFLKYQVTRPTLSSSHNTIM